MMHRSKFVADDCLKSRVCNASYVGRRGYVIPKTCFDSMHQINQLKLDLTVKPFVIGSPVQSGSEYPVYRESTKNIYVPRQYGIDRFGPPHRYAFGSPEHIAVPFVGKLRECQQHAVDAYLSTVNSEFGGCGLIEKGCGKGKTVDGLYLAAVLGVKALIIVHKEFLMNQWIERIQTYMPSARVGKIQGSVMDIAGKDIVIGMLQSISMKDYASDAFGSFGLTIVDEVHHISSEVFSKALFKISTKYMLGLSATMNRKDGTTNVIKMFLGNIVYSNLEQDSNSVTVRSIKYLCDNDDFCETVYDFRGNVQYSSMVSKLSTYSRRTDMAVDVMIDVTREFGSSQQILVLSQVKNVLKYVFDALHHKGFHDVGYYVGGMKQCDLDTSATKQIILATYSMAAEALDIPSLTTLIMLTPKTDIHQSIGRILRQKHTHPLIIDIVDVHDVFKRQYSKRKHIYKSNGYKIFEMTHSEYFDDTRCAWKEIDMASVTISSADTCRGSGVLDTCFSQCVL